MVKSATVTSGAAPGSYRSLLARLREHLRAYVAKQLLLPRQEVQELIAANLRAVGWLAAALGLVVLFLVALVVLVIALIAIILPLPLAALAAMALFALLAAIFGYTGYRKLQLRGPERSIRSFKETISWVKATLLGRSES